MADYVRAMIAIAAQWRVLQAIGPAASALVGVPVSQPKARRARPKSPAGTKVASSGNGHRQPKKGATGKGRSPAC